MPSGSTASTTVFCVPGESYLAALDALYDARDAIATIACRHEGGAANMAEACGKLTGRPGVVMVTRGSRAPATPQRGCIPRPRTRRRW